MNWMMNHFQVSINNLTTFLCSPRNELKTTKERFMDPRKKEKTNAISFSFSIDTNDTFLPTSTIMKIEESYSNNNKNAIYTCFYDIFIRTHTIPTYDKAHSIFSVLLFFANLFSYYLFYLSNSIHTNPKHFPLKK